MPSYVIPAYENLDRAQHAEHDTRLIHVVDILRPNGVGRILKNSADDLEPLRDLVIYVFLMALLVYRLYPFALLSSGWRLPKA